MTPTAKVHSIDALPRLAAAVQAMAAETTIALDELTMQLHRAIQWVQYDQKEYWTHQYRRAQEEVAEARINLERRKLFRIGDQQPSCREEKMALEAAKRRVEVSRQKIEAVRRWSRLLERESTDCKSAVAPLGTWTQTDVPRALALLKHMGAALDEYVGSQGPAIASASPAVEGGPDRPAVGVPQAQEVSPKPLAADAAQIDKLSGPPAPPAMDPVRKETEPCAPGT